MERIITCLLSAIISLSAYAQLADGYYRLQCKETGRYLAIHDNYVNKESAKSSGHVYLQSLETITGFDNIVNDPGSVIYLKKMPSGYIIEGQGFTTEGRNMYLQFTEVNGAYRIWTEITYEGYKYPARYLRDYEEEPGYSYIITDPSKSSNWEWYVTPVTDADNQYMGLKGDVKAGDNYYTTFYASFPIQLGTGMKAYAVDALTESKCTLKDVGNIVPKNTPVVIACAGKDAANNKVTPLTTGGSAVSSNKPSGVTFCYPVIVGGKEKRNNPYWNVKDYDPETMRLLGEDGGKLAFITDSEMKYLPANRAYLKVAEGSAASIPTDGTTGVQGVKIQTKPAVKGRYTLQGVPLPDNVEPKGIYIEDGKKVVRN